MEQRRPRFSLTWTALLAAVAAVMALSWWACISMPGRNFRGQLPPLTREQILLRSALSRDIRFLSGQIGERNVGRHPELIRAQYFIEQSLAGTGAIVSRQGFEVNGRSCFNLIAEFPGSSKASEIVVIGAHYDTAPGTPGADDNASGVAAVLALARTFQGISPARTLRFILFVNEEPPYFRTPLMGSRIYAENRTQLGEEFIGMLSLEMLGYYSEQPRSQKYPFPFSLIYPRHGDFVAFVGNLMSRGLIRQCVGSFRQGTAFPSEGLAAPGLIEAAGDSDHWAFWEQRIPALMVTDTAYFRNPHYHGTTDTWETLDMDRLTRVVTGLQRVVADLAEVPPVSK